MKREVREALNYAHLLGDAQAMLYSSRKVQVLAYDLRSTRRRLARAIRLLRMLSDFPADKAMALALLGYGGSLKKFLEEP